MANKSLKKIKEKLLRSPLSELNGKELGEYFNYRLDNLIMSKKLLVGRELEYLLCDVGKGSLRFDPELLACLNKKEVVAEDRLKPALKETEEKKVKIQLAINTFLDSSKNADLFVRLISHYCEKVAILQNKPLIVRAEYETTPVMLLIRNGRWLMPDEVLFNFIKLAKENKSQPIIIAKKIHGILFPFFKGTSVLGLNIYSTLIDKQNIKLIAEFKNEATLSDYYNERIDDLEDIAENITSDYYEENLLKKFFEILVPKYLEVYHQSFIKQKIKITDFENTVKQIKGAKAKNGILKWIEKRRQLLSELK